MEQIVGDISDEHDNLKSNNNIKKIKKSTFMVSGATTLIEFNEFFKSDYRSDRFDTISGLLINNFKGLPKTHDEISFDNFKFQIKISDQRRIHSIQVEIKD